MVIGCVKALFSHKYILGSNPKLSIIVWFQKLSTLLQRRVIGNSYGEEVLKAKLLEEKYEAKLEFPWEEG